METAELNEEATAGPDEQQTAEFEEKMETAEPDEEVTAELEEKMETAELDEEATAELEEKMETAELDEQETAELDEQETADFEEKMETAELRLQHHTTGCKLKHSRETTMWLWHTARWRLTFLENTCYSARMRSDSVACIYRPVAVGVALTSTFSKPP